MTGLRYRKMNNSKLCLIVIFITTLSENLFRNVKCNVGVILIFIQKICECLFTLFLFTLAFVANGLLNNSDTLYEFPGMDSFLFYQLESLNRSWENSLNRQLDVFFCSF